MKGRCFLPGNGMERNRKGRKKQFFMMPGAPWKTAFLVAVFSMYALIGFSATYNMKEYFPLESGFNEDYHFEHSEGLSGTANITISGPVYVSGNKTYIIKQQFGSYWYNDYYNWAGGYLCIYKWLDYEGDWEIFTNPGEIAPEYLNGSASNQTVGNGGQYYGDDYTGYNSHSITCYGLTNISVPAGTFEVLHIRIHGEWHDNDGYWGYGDRDLYLLKGFGIVLMEDDGYEYDADEGEWEHGMQSFSLKSQPVTPTPTPTPTPVNHPPQIWNGKVLPSEGSVTDSFNFIIDYFDPDGHSPSTKKVYIDGASHYMSLYSGSSSNGTYTYTTSLGSGNHSFYFYFKDTKGASARLPQSGSFSGPIVHATPTPTPTPLPDLTVESMWWNPVKPKASEPVVLGFKARNWGQTASPDCRFKLTLDGTYVTGGELPGINGGGGEIVIQNVQLGLFPGGDHKLEVAVDSQGTVNESNESNNTLSGISM